MVIKESSKFLKNSSLITLRFQYLIYRIGFNFNFMVFALKSFFDKNKLTKFLINESYY